MSVVDSLLGKNARRFVKRKDSDAGEIGLSLEELRSTLYNDFSSSEGAKRQQQRYCGPLVAMSFNFMVSVGIIMANKMVMGKVGFSFPIALSLIHYLTAWFLMAVFRLFSLLPVSPPSKSTPFSSLFLLQNSKNMSAALAVNRNSNHKTQQTNSLSSWKQPQNRLGEDPNAAAESLLSSLGNRRGIDRAAFPTPEERVIGKVSQMRDDKKGEEHQIPLQASKFCQIPPKASNSSQT